MLCEAYGVEDWMRDWRETGSEQVVVVKGILRHLFASVVLTADFGLPLDRVLRISVGDHAIRRGRPKVMDEDEDGGGDLQTDAPMDRA